MTLGAYNPAYNNLQGQAGNIQNQVALGKGGSFSLVTNSIGDFSGLNQKLAAGGFNKALNIEASTGDITIAASDYVRPASHVTVTLTADSG